MSKTLLERLTSSDEGMRLFQQAKLELDFTELICGLIEGQNCNREYIAEKMDLTLDEIECLLDGNNDIDLQTASDLAWALGKTLTFHVEPLTIHTKPDEEESK